MKVRVIDVEGSPDELAQLPQLMEAISGEPKSDGHAQQGLPGLSPEVQQLLNDRTPPEALARVERLESPVVFRRGRLTPVEG